MKFQYPLKGLQFLRAPVERGSGSRFPSIYSWRTLQGISLTNPTPRLWRKNECTVKKKHQKKQVSNKKTPGWLGYIGDYTNQLYIETYNKPLQGVPGMTEQKTTTMMESGWSSLIPPVHWQTSNKYAWNKRRRKGLPGWLSVVNEVERSPTTNQPLTGDLCMIFLRPAHGIFRSWNGIPFIKKQRFHGWDGITRFWSM